MQLILYSSNGVEKARFSPSDSSTQTKEIQGDNVLGLSFTLYEFVPIDVNDYIDYEGERYRALEKYAPSEKSTVEWEYSVQFYGVESLIKRFLVLNNTDGDNEAVFTLTDKPRAHVSLIVACINAGMGTSDWKVGAVDGAENVVIDYHGKYCDEALKELAEAVGVEWWIEGTTVNLTRCCHGTELTIGYGNGNGLVSLSKDAAENAKFYTRLFPIGSSRNIDPANYNSHSRLQLPGGAKYVDQPGMVEQYGIIHHYEQEAFAGIYPRRIGTVSSVRSAQATGEDGKPYTIYYFKDNSLEFDPNNFELPGEVKRVSFQEGSELAGLGESDDHYFEVNYNSATHEFEIITIWPYDDDTQLPGGLLIPKVGDRYILWNIRMPDTYIAQAEQEFLDAVEQYNADHLVDVTRYKGQTDHVWVESEGVSLFVGRQVRLVSTEYFAAGYRQSRITKLTRRVNLPSLVDLEICDALSRSSFEKIGDEIGDARNYAATLFRGIALPDLIRVGDRTQPTDNNLYSARRSHEEFLSRKSNDTAQGFLSFLAGISIGPAETWGYVKKVTENGAEKIKSWFKNLWTDVLTVSAYIKGESGTVKIEGNLYGTGSAEFDGDLYAEGSIRSGGDVVADNNIIGTDGKFSRDVDVKGTVTTTNLTVTGIAHFFQLVIDSVRSAGGAALFTPADGFKVEAVTKFFYDGGWRVRLWWRATDGDRAIKNMWRSGMQAICMNFNEAAPGHYENVSNHHYWAVVAYTATENGTPIWDERNPAYVKAKEALAVANTEPVNPYEVTDWHFIDIFSNADEPSDRQQNPTYWDGKPTYVGEPWTAAVGDDVAQLGYRGQDDDLLKNALYISAYTSLDMGDTDANIRGLVAPLMAYYEGIDDFNLSRHRTTFKDALGGEWVGDMKVTADVTLEEYINQKLENLDINADFYRLRPLKEDAWVAADKTLSVSLQYNLEHVQNGTAGTEAWTNSGYTVEVKSNGSSVVSTDSNPSYGTGASGKATFTKTYTSTATKPDYFTVALKKDGKVIDQRVVRVSIKAGTVFSVTDTGVSAAIQAADEKDALLRTEFNATVGSIRSQVSSIPVSRNLLLNSDFATMAETANGCIHLVPTTFWQGYQQESRNAQGEWVDRLVGGATYTLSFYARGKGRVGAIVHHTLLAGDTSQGNQDSMLENLTPKPKLYTMTFTPSVSCPFRVMIGSNSYGIGEMPGTEIYISRPKLVRNSESTTNLLTNPQLADVTDGVPQGWTLWDNWESGSAAPVTIREIVPELFPPNTPVAWEQWTNGDTGLSPTLNVTGLENGVYPINIVPRSYWNGLVQRSYVRSGADNWDGSAKVLKHDTWYTLSFEAKGMQPAVRAGFIIDCVSLRSGTDKFGKTVGGDARELDLTTGWERYTYKFKAQANYDTSATDIDGYGFSLMLGLVNAISGTYTRNIIQIRCPQLEEGETATEWRRGEENAAFMQTQFEQFSDRMELGVYRDGVKRSGMRIDRDGVEFDGDRVRINGDLDLQGLMTENVTIVGRNESHPTIINMGVGVSGDDVVKSVQVTSFTPYENDYGDMVYDEGTHMVVLPFYDDIVTRGYSHPDNNEYWPNRTDISFSREDGSFLLSLKDDIPLCKRKVVEWRKNGTRLTVSNEFINKYRNWPNYQGSDPYEGNSMPRSLVVVCADGRIVASENIRSNRQFNPSEMGGQDDNILHGGCFSCMGRLARFIVLLPGQTLQLRSQIVTVGSFRELDEEADTLSTEARRVLIWVVENPTEFEPLLPRTAKLIFDCQKDRVMYSLEYLSGLASYNTVNTYHSWNDTILAPAVLNKMTDFDESIGIEW